MANPEQCRMPIGGKPVDAAGAAVRAALDSARGATSGFDRAAPMRWLAELIGENAEHSACLEVSDSGKLCRIRGISSTPAGSRAARRARRRERNTMPTPERASTKPSWLNVSSARIAVAIAATTAPMTAWRSVSRARDLDPRQPSLAHSAAGGQPPSREPASPIITSHTAGGMNVTASVDSVLTVIVNTSGRA